MLSIRHCHDDVLIVIYFITKVQFFGCSRIQTYLCVSPLFFISKRLFCAYFKNYTIMKKLPSLLVHCTTTATDLKKQIKPLKRTL